MSWIAPRACGEAWVTPNAVVKACGSAAPARTWATALAAPSRHSASESGFRRGR